MMNDECVIMNGALASADLSFIILHSSFPIKYWVQGRVVVHLHLPVQVDESVACVNVFDQFVEAAGQVGFLLGQHGQFLRGPLPVFLRHIGAFGLFAEVIQLQLQNRHPVEQPGRRLGVHTGRRPGRNRPELLVKKRVNQFNCISAVLIRLVDSALYCNQLVGADGRAADNVFQMPLHGINPVLPVEQSRQVIGGIRIGQWRIDIVGQVVVVYALPKDVVGGSGVHRR